MASLENTVGRMDHPASYDSQVLASRRSMLWVHPASASVSGTAKPLQRL